jgi:hypothetical protein
VVVWNGSAAFQKILNEIRLWERVMMFINPNASPDEIVKSGESLKRDQNGKEKVLTNQYLCQDEPMDS